MRSKEKNVSSGSVQFEKHAPERRGRVRAYLFCNGGCCCCCCCLHSLGGLIGAVAATTNSSSPRAEPVAGWYWACLLLSAVATVVFTCSSADGFGIFAALIFLPLVQLLASILTLIWIGIRSSDLADKKARLQMLGKITLYSLLGALAGGFAMFVGFKMFN